MSDRITGIVVLGVLSSVFRFPFFYAPKNPIKSKKVSQKRALCLKTGRAAGSAGRVPGRRNLYRFPESLPKRTLLPDRTGLVPLAANKLEPRTLFMKRLYLLASAAIIGSTLLSQATSFARGGGHSHASHGHASHNHASGSQHGAAPHAATHRSVQNHSAHAPVAGHPSTSSHNFAHHSNTWHHNRGAYGYWNGLGDGFVAPSVVAPWSYDQYWSDGPNPVVVPAGGEIVTSEYSNNVATPVVPRPAPACPFKSSPAEPSDVP